MLLCSAHKVLIMNNLRPFSQRRRGLTSPTLEKGPFWPPKSASKTTQNPAPKKPKSIPITTAKRNRNTQ